MSAGPFRENPTFLIIFAISVAFKLLTYPKSKSIGTVTGRIDLKSANAIGT